MIKKLLATTLATLSIVSMSLPAMAVNGTETPAQPTEQSIQQTASHKKRVSYRKGKKAKKAKNSTQSKNDDMFNDFVNIDKSSIKYDPINFIEEAENIEKDNKDIQLYEEKDAENGFVEIEVSANQKQALKDMDKSAGYIAIRNNVKALKQHASNSYYAAGKFDATKTCSEAWNTIKDVAYIAGDTACYPISGGLRYAHKNGLLKEAFKYGANYALGFIGFELKEKESDKKEDGKIASSLKIGKSFFNNWFSKRDKDKK